MSNPNGRPRNDFPIEDAIALYKTGISVLEVARLLRQSRGTTRRRLEEEGVLRTPNRKALEEIKQRIGKAPTL